MKKLLLLLLIASATRQSHAQLQGQPLIDSLLTQLPTANEDTNKVKLLNDLSLTYYSINPDEGLKFGKQGLALAEKLNWKKGTAYAYKVIAGNYGYGKSEYARALEHSLKALQQFREMEDKTGTAKVLGDIGVVYWFQSDHPNALKYFFDALRINEERGIKNEIAATLCNIGIVYNSQEDYPKALEYMLKANRIDEELGNKSGMAANLGNIGELHMSLSDTTKALEYDLKSLQLYEELGDKNGIARNLANIGTVYTEKREYSKALEYYFKALKMHEELGHKIGIAMNLGNIGDTYLEIAKDNTTAGKYNSYQNFPRNKTVALQQAKGYTDSAINILKEIGDLNTLFSNYRRLSEIQTLLGDNKGALESYTNYTLFKDSVFNMEKNKKLTETAMRYEFDKKESATKAEQEKKDILQRNIRNSFIAGATLLLLLLIGLINRYRYKQKANKELAAAYENLKATQQQLVQSEKMAAFGVMATRMAHEIQNPLNFVNNFSLISKELVQDILSSHDEEVKNETADLLINNLEKINHHGNRVAGIVNQLQEHARAGTALEFFEEEKK
ncbi:MAG: tetratricopeptide repeat protein [Chitinophagaceae bacterium]|nr:tetratricopeptide repeat protein [Chitinophagaceae bacterium]